MGKRKADSLESSPSSGASDRKSKKPKKDKHKHKVRLCLCCLCSEALAVSRLRLEAPCSMLLQDKRDKQARKQEKKLLKEAKKLVARGEPASAASALSRAHACSVLTPVCLQGQSGAAPPPPAKAEPAPDQVCTLANHIILTA